MEEKKNTFYITTAIDYPNANPHMGHAYEKIVTDVLARWNALLGKDVFFMTGLDEHGQKLQLAAEKEGISPQAFVDKKSLVFKDLCKSLRLSNNHFIRTSSKEHESIATSIFQKVVDSGEIYKGNYVGLYSIKEETFVTERQITEGNLDRAYIKEVEEEAYFFKMSKYQERLVSYIKEHPEFIQPKTRRNEILSRLENDDLRDLCVSRSTFDWGIPLPNDSTHVMYVWFDALSNYITGIGYPDQELYKKFWPANVHVIGKDILWFHTVIWPIILMAIDAPLPKTVYIHGFINDSHGEKMSKTKGNVVDPLELLSKYGVDPLRYYLLRTVSSGEDGNFSETDLIASYNKELANDLGNLVLRVTKMITSHFEGPFKGTLRDESGCEYANELQDASKSFIEELENIFSKFEYHRALDAIWGKVREINQYLNKTEPWKIKDDNEKLKDVLYHSIDHLAYYTLLLKPFIPDTVQAILASLGPSDSLTFAEDFVFGRNTYTITVGDALFPKIDTKKKSDDASSVKEKMEEQPKKQEPSFDAVDIRLGKIIEVDDHPDADKLYVMKVDFGTEQRQIVAGLKAYYSKEDLLNKITSFVFNLEFAKLRGVESQGMVLIAETEDEETLCFVQFGSSAEESVQSDDLVGKQVSFDGTTDVVDKEMINYKLFSKVKLEVTDGAVTCDGKPLMAAGQLLFAPIVNKGFLC